MKYLVILFISLGLLSCGGSLSESQRDAIKKSMQDGKIQRVSSSQITTAGLERGQSILKVIGEDVYLGNKNRVDSIAQQMNAVIYLMRSETVNPGTKSAEIWDAYQNASNLSDMKDNIQKIGTDSLLFTRPITYERPDGSSVLSHAIAVMIAVKDVVIGLEEN